MVCYGQHNLSMDFSLSAHGLPIYYLPGHGGRITNGLGQALVARGYEVVGRETVGDFKKLDFNDQVATIAKDIKEYFWSENAKIIANSFGGYLLLHALAKLTPYIGKIDRKSVV